MTILATDTDQLAMELERDDRQLTLELDERVPLDTYRPEGRRYDVTPGCPVKVGPGRVPWDGGWTGGQLVRLYIERTGRPLAEVTCPGMAGVRTVHADRLMRA